jgi:hypothetical protein
MAKKMTLKQARARVSRECARLEWDPKTLHAFKLVGLGLDVAQARMQQCYVEDRPAGTDFQDAVGAEAAALRRLREEQGLEA